MEKYEAFLAANLARVRETLTLAKSIQKESREQRQELEKKINDTIAQKQVEGRTLQKKPAFVALREDSSQPKKVFDNRVFFFYLL